ncbi:non-specific serine/threonine protein kinase, protein kinase C [Trachipleistophora hominis]|uniref:Non-specific serine/threonine protein kinase, protein kinase C n=1 Tax=Trachipleistophora hominis TaxID=72359 RepID=L7JZS0_TRAHO|nr:non-specific serine/threonine protein kinase, protein kinase C [Trachipleistophora hominis]
MAVFDEQFEMYERIGYGRFGNVYRAVYKPTGEMMAVKIIRKDALHSCYIANEVRLGSLILHHGIVHVKFLFHNDTHFFIAMELLEGVTLENLINSQRFTEDEARVYVFEIVKALHFLHSHHIMHRDIKPSNIMVCKTGIKIVDLGTLSLFQGYPDPKNNMTWVARCDTNERGSVYETYNISKTDENAISILNSLGRNGNEIINSMNIRRTTAERCGTPLYSAPELLFVRANVTDKVDVWSLGCLIYRMITGVEKFSGNDSSEIEDSILNKPLDIDSMCVSESLKKLLERMLQRDYVRRISIEDVLASDWLSSLSETYMTRGVCVFCGDSLDMTEQIESDSLFKICNKCEDQRREEMGKYEMETCFLNDVPIGKLNQELVEIKLTMWGLCKSLDAAHRNNLKKLFALRPEAVDQVGEIKYSREVALEVAFSRQLKARFGKPRGCFTLPDICSYMSCRVNYKDPNLRSLDGKQSIFKIRMFFKNVIFKTLDLKTRMIRGMSYGIIVSNEPSGPKISLSRRGGRISDFQNFYVMIRNNFIRMERIDNSWYRS